MNAAALLLLTCLALLPAVVGKGEPRAASVPVEATADPAGDRVGRRVTMEATGRDRPTLPRRQSTPTDGRAAHALATGRAAPELPPPEA